MPLELSHVTIGASDFAASLAFYDAVFAALGVDRLADYVDEEEDDADVEVAVWDCFWLVSGPPSRHAHVAVTARTSAEVDAVHAAALRSGGTSARAPRRWTLYRRGRYGAIVADPDGNQLEVTAPE